MGRVGGEKRAPGGARETLRVRLLGGFGVSVGRRTIGAAEWRLTKACSVMKLLALSPGHCLHREQLSDVLWPRLTPRAASNNLRGSLHAARCALAADPAVASGYLVSRAGSIYLCPGGGLWVDAEAFEGAAVWARRVEEPSAYESALALYTGDLLPDDRYEVWAEDRRLQIRETYLSLLLGLARSHEARGDYGSAGEALLQTLATDPLREEAHADLMRLRALSGHKAEALGQYRRLTEVLSRELKTGPSASSRALAEEISSGRFPPPDRPIAPGQESAPGTPRHNLPAPRTGLVGRGRELVEIERELSATRMLTLTGAGGTGKTRLALEAARGLVGTYPDGVWLAELAPLSEPRLVSRAVAGALGVTERIGRPLLDTLVDELRGKSVLLVLDNCEHLVDAAASLADVLLGACPRVRVMATSREPLGVTGEAVRTVPPLSVPAPRQGAEGVAHHASVRLFVERARLRLPGFGVTPGNCRAIAEVCRRVGGIPLAVELAAARVGTLSVEQMACRLERSLGLLGAGPRTALERHRTMRASLEWSHEPLDEPERGMFARLSAFSGGWTLEAAEAVGPGNDVDEGGVLGLLSGLVDKSLVVAETSRDGGVRYGMLEPIRQHAREKLEDGGHARSVRRRHAAFFLALAEVGELELRGPEQGEWLERLETEHDNFRAALSWALDIGAAELALSLAGALGEFWHIRGHLSEGRRWLDAALNLVGTPSVLRIKALAWAGWMAWEQGEFGRSAAFAGEGLTLSRRLGDTAGVAASLYNMGIAAEFQEEHEKAKALFEEAVGLQRERGDRAGLARALQGLGMAVMGLGESRRAEALYEESLALARESGDIVGIEVSRGGSALNALAQDDYERVRRICAEMLRSSRQLDYWAVASAALNLLASSAGSEGQAVRAARLWGASKAMREAMGKPDLSPVERTTFARHKVAARGRLGEAAWQAAWAEGRAMGAEQAVEYALSEEEASPPEDAVRERPSAGTQVATLTRREEEIAELVAHGLTNRQIASDLYISEHTAATHVARILKKLGLRSRAQIGSWLTERRLSPSDPD